MSLRTRIHIVYLCALCVLMLIVGIKNLSPFIIFFAFLMGHVGLDSCYCAITNKELSLFLVYTKNNFWALRVLAFALGVGFIVYSLVGILGVMDVH